MNLKKFSLKALSVVMAMFMVMAVCAPTIAAVNDNQSINNATVSAETEINYVSIGDSMTNGYGFEGYEQNSNDRNVYDFVNGKNVYGEGSYALQFEEYLAEKYGATVNHTKLAPSGLLADDLLYLLGVRETEFDDNWGGYRDYVGTYSDEELQAHFQTAVTEADIITLCIGNASFGAYLVQQIVNTIGIMGAEGEVDPDLTLENGLALLESDAKIDDIVVSNSDSDIWLKTIKSEIDSMH